MAKKLLSSVFVLSVIAFNSVAQQNTGSLKGTVTDELGSLVVNARVLARDVRGATISVTTNSAGIYDFKNLAPGSYDLRVVAPGFNAFEEKSIEVSARHTTTFDLQLSVAFEEQSVTIDDKGVSTDSDKNADAVVLRGQELEALPNDPQALAAALQSMAGPTDGETSPQIKVDGFANGQIPPKESIREVRINQNPYSAENEYPGFSGIEIFTQPGSEKWHGAGSFDFNDESLNSRNPFTTIRAPYQQRSMGANLSGPIVHKRASFSFFLYRYASDSNSIVNATILDPSTLKPVGFNESLVTPQVSTYSSSRVDFKINKKHTLVSRLGYNKYSQDLQGIGGFSLPSRAFRGKNADYTLQITETALLNEKTVNETRLQFIHRSFRQTANTTLPALNVLDSFFGGGAQTGSASNTQDRAELQNFTSWSAGHHFVKIGGRFRYVRIRSVSPANFGGTFTFTGGSGPKLDSNDQIVADSSGQPTQVEISSLERYRRTLQFARNGWSAAQIRSLGGGATQFSISGGNPEADVNQLDVSLYFQDEWKVGPHFTLSPGLRYENQNNINSGLNFAPRLGFAWSPSFSHSKKESPAVDAKQTAPDKPASTTPVTTPARSQPRIVFRGGVGIFYNRISEDLTLQTLRFNGANQRQFVVSDPSVLDLFPVVPPLALLDAFAQPQTRRAMAENIDPSASLRFSFSVERQLNKKVKASLSYSHNHTLRTLRSVNINAPLVGTVIASQPASGVRPLGQSAGNILEYQSSGRSVGNTLSLSLNGMAKKLNFWSSLNLSKGRNTDSGTSGSPFDPYDFSHEWARNSFGSLISMYIGGNYQGPLGLSLNTFIVGSSGSTFNIITGHDTNGDTFFTERPAFATDLNKPGVIMTPLGAFDPNPSPGQQIIPRNFGRGPGFLSVNFGMEKVFKFGKAIAPQSPAPASARSTDATASGQKPPPKPPIQKPYQLSFSVYANNALNHTNKGNPVGNMTSPYFLKSPGASSNFFGPGGGSGGNRQVSLRVRFSF
jgi:hypothetical protein